MNKFSIIPLGSGGWYSNDFRETTCWMLELKNVLFIIDLGSGLRRLLSPEWQSYLDEKSNINILLTHFHLDHIIGLFYMQEIFSERKINIFAPGKNIYGETASNIINNLMREPFASELGSNIVINDLKSGYYNIDKIDIEFWEQKHSSPSLGFCIDNSIIFALDTYFKPSMKDIYKGSHCVIHDCWQDRRGTKEDPHYSHCNVDQVANLAYQSNIKNLFLAHLNPTYSEERLKNMLQQAKEKFEATILPREEKVYEFGR